MDPSSILGDSTNNIVSCFYLKSKWWRCRKAPSGYGKLDTFYILESGITPVMPSAEKN